jgi:hypothetical protein
MAAMLDIGEDPVANARTPASGVRLTKADVLNEGKEDQKHFSGPSPATTH